jgi:tetratricopeptide (TPR) repeat protein
LEVDPSFSCLASRIVLSKVRMRLAQYVSIIEEVSDYFDAFCCVTISSELKIHFHNQSGIFLKIHSNDETDHDYSDLCENMLIGICVCLANLGQNDLCNSIIFKASLLHKIFRIKKALIYILPSLLQENFLEISLNDIIKELDENDDAQVQLVTEIILRFNQKQCDKDKALIIEKFLNSQLIKSIKINNFKRIGISHYNLANHFRSRCSFKLAFQHYLLAKKYYKNYLNFDYYFNEIGGVLFELGRYYFSSKAYLKALELGCPIFNTKALYANSLMFQGRYREAMELFDSYLTETKENFDKNEEWLLKFICLSSLMESGYPPIQKRKLKMNCEQLFINETDSSETILTKCQKAIESDMLCAMAWYNYGILYSKNKKWFSSFISYLFCALIARMDIEAWVEAFSHAIISSAPTIYIHQIIRLAYFYNGELFIQSVHNSMKGFNSEQIKSTLDMIDICIASGFHKEKTIRLLTGDSFESINL